VPARVTRQSEPQVAPQGWKGIPAQKLLERCELCEWRCGVDRTAGQRGPCGLGIETRILRQYVSVTEELEVIPALRVYLGGCNFRCRFCDTAPDCLEPDRGDLPDPGTYAQELAGAVGRGVQSISVLGGEPTLHAHTLLEWAAAAPTPLPLVVNTNLYMTGEVLHVLDGLIRFYLGDFKFGNDECAQRLAGVPHYSYVIRRNLTWIAGRTPLIVRHLLMPGHLECCLRPAAEWLSANLPGTRFQFYAGYVPCWQAGTVGLGRLNSRGEVRAALDLLDTLDLDWRAGGNDKA
jgi:putative pyruvate formate lyase activating enzyme